ncbi:MFS multidrug transporter-like protein [Hypoxylon sp. FL0890]|nr:MFS multidrug transporter-like protein [Hypoxylon sp. FL0890]
MRSQQQPSMGDGKVDNDAPTVVYEIDDRFNYIQGYRYWLVLFSLGVMMFIVNFEIPVVATTVVAITSDIGGDSDRTWLLTSYLLGYVSIIVISSKLSDIYGRRPLFIACMLIFLIFSAACSAAQTITQLIIFRAFQGLGGGGSYSLGTIITIELVPKAHIPATTARLSITVSLGLLLGPIIGGVISSNTTWRWIFIMIVPFAAVCLAFIILGMPKDFPYQGRPNQLQHNFNYRTFKSTLGRLDIQGALLLLFAVVSLTAGFEEADSRFPWSSAYVITLLTLSGVFWLLLLVWERHVTNKSSIREPVLTWRFFTNRHMMGVLLTFLFLGGPFVVSVYQLPQRFQLVNGLNGLDAALRLIPFTIASPLGTGLAAAVAGKFKVPAILIIITGACLQVIGFSLLGTLPITTDLLPRTYGFEVIAGFGCGMNLALLFVIIPLVAEQRDQAVGMGAASQFRMMGSAISAAVVTSVYNGRLVGMDTSDMGGERVRLMYAGAFNQQMIVLAAFAAAQIPSALLLWKKPQIRT